ncbi:Smr/MutS family protein [Erythrobacteraceae bacterium E2-1 Yellow Sea]|nr:Smr/MutS family protein [Erythrobacteraceae bacterium E2-1 Yellow Sea]
MSVPRGLSAEEAAAWAKLASSVTPLEGRKRISAPEVTHPVKSHVQHKVGVGIAPQPTMPAKSRPAPAPGAGLDSHWERKIKSGSLQPDFTLDLHGHTLDSAYDRLMHGIDQARAVDARVVLLISGRHRPVDPADRGERRGAIRAKILDWLAASRHGDAISAVRKAHIRHGGEGALYLVLKRAR